jgi:hypothetical protein
MSQQKISNEEPDAATSLLCLEDSPVRTQVAPGCNQASMENNPDSYTNSCDYSMIYTQIMQYLKTSLGSVQTDFKKCSQKLPKSGMMRNGILYELPGLEHPIKENASLLWPTPSGTSNHHKNHVSGRLDEWGGSSNPFRGTSLAGVRCANFEEWMMGFHTGWTEWIQSGMRSSRNKSTRSLKPSQTLKEESK